MVDRYQALCRGDEELAVQAYRTWGFHHLTRPVTDALNIWARFLFEPLLEDRQRTLGDLTGDIHGRDTAERVIAALHRAGGVGIPRAVVIMDRAAIGLSAAFLQLQAAVNWHRRFEELIAGFHQATLARRQAEMLTRHGIPLPPTPAGS